MYSGKNDIFSVSFGIKVSQFIFLREKVAREVEQREGSPFTPNHT